MEKIAFIMPSFSLPVDASRGGAIEQLMNVLIEENEDIGKYQFTFLSPYRVSKKYYHTTVIKIRNFYPTNFIKRVFNKFLKIFGVKKRIELNYEANVRKVLLKNQFDKVIFEGECLENISKIKKYDRKNVFYHVHHQVKLKKDLSVHIGNLISVSNFISDDWKKNGCFSKNINFFVLKNCLTSNNFYNKNSKEDELLLRQSLGIEKDDYVILYCGRLIPEKGIDKLIESIILLNKEKVKLLIIGQSFFEGSSETPFEKKLKILSDSMRENIIFTGYIPNEMLYKYYNLADLQVVPSTLEEAAGLVALEGRVCGIPQIITNSGGIREYASPEATVIEKEGDLINSLKDAISKKILLREGKLKSRELEEYSKKTFYKNFISIIEEDLNG